MTKNFNIAITGAQTSLGRHVLTCLSERHFPTEKIYALDDQKYLGNKLSFGEDRVLEVDNIDDFNFSKTDLVFICSNSNNKKHLIDEIIEGGAIVIDTTASYPSDINSPMIVPEVNPEEIKNIRNIISNPHNCTIPIVTVLKPLDNAVKIKRVIISTYQSVSDLGKQGMDELYNQTKNRYMGGEVTNHVFNKQIAFNLIAQIGSTDNNGNSSEELQISHEIQKILGRHIQCCITCVRVPIFIGNSMSLNIEFCDKINATEVVELLTESDGLVTYPNENLNVITPVEISGEDYIYVSRVRDDPSLQNSINLWIQTDNLRKGSALNAVQIAELL
jgi:aspartate-semialdehyde dehydrogenase